jgi:CRISPR system Cascade subunit CasA
MPTFNLVEQPWIPALPIGSRRPVEQSLRDVLVNAHELQEITDPAPTVSVALHRLLLAVLHRVFGPRDMDEWDALRANGRFDEHQLNEYLTAWCHRFDIFDDTRPFYQASWLPADSGAEITKLSHELVSSGNRPTLFDHTLDAAFDPARAARYLVSFQSFGPPGTVTHAGGFTSAKASPLVKNMVVLLRGETLFETLLLNLHQYDDEVGIPFEGPGSDLPAWERDEETHPGGRIPSGYVDLLTWQSRSLLLIAEPNSMVRRVVIAEGARFAAVFERQLAETMVPFVEIEKPREGEPAYQPLAIREDRAVWRDSSALLQSLGSNNVRPRMFDWLSQLSVYGYIGRSAILPADVMGILNNPQRQAQLILWRREHLPVPSAYLRDDLLVQALGAMLTLAERVSSVLYTSTRTLLEYSLAPTRDQLGGRKPDATGLRQLTSSVAPTQTYWSRLEAPFRDMMLRLAEDQGVDQFGDVHYGSQVLPAWRETVRQTARNAFQETTRGMGTTSRTVKAVAIAERKFNRELGQTIDRWIEQPEEGAVS